MLWFLRQDYYPRTDPERWRVLDSIQKPATSLPEELSAGRVVFHEGRILGAFPELRSPVAPPRR